MKTPSFREAFRAFAKVGLLSFGGPAGQIALMHRVLVDEEKWIAEEKFLRALNFCMLLPGPEAHQLAVYIGWLLHGVKGGLMAGLLFLLPGVAVVFALSALYAGYHELPAVAAALFGLKAAVLAIVIEALVRIGRRALTHASRLALALGAFIAIYFLGIPFPVIVAGAAAIGAIGGRWNWPGFRPKADAKATVATAPRTETSFFKTLTIGLVLWLGPLLTLGLAMPGVFADLAALFIKLAVVTFGGAYAVLAYLAQEAVTGYGWLAPKEMIDGLGLAETTPGPLILVVDFVGYLAGARAGGLAPLLGGALGTLVAVWATFVPSFLWIFLGAPFVERIKGGGVWDSALAGVTAAVTGVVLNLALWFGLHVLFGEVGAMKAAGLSFPWPVLASVDGKALALFALSLIALFRFRLGILTVIFGAALLGLGVLLL
jgi:chromate transporter